MKGRLVERVEAVLNRHVAESTAAVELVEALEGRSFAIRVEGLGVSCVLRAQDGRLRVADEADAATGPADAAISGTPLDLIRLLGPDIASRLPGSAAHLTGAVHVAEGFAGVLRLAMPDLEEELSGWVGDVAAHEIGRLSRSVVEWAGRAAEALRLDASEYLQEESRVVPSRCEAEEFYAGVERLRDDVERTAERVERLASRVAGG
jgi:ubiquinone biosynthesis accessory factor UbiJ